MYLLYDFFPFQRVLVQKLQTLIIKTVCPLGQLPLIQKIKKITTVPTLIE